MQRDHAERDGRDSVQQQRAAAAAGSMGCPECHLPLLGRIAALVPCGHLVHAQCAVFFTSLSRSHGRLCPQCGKPVDRFVPVHVTGGDETQLPKRAVEAAANARTIVERLQQDLIRADTEIREASQRKQQVQRQCAEVHLENQRLKNRIAVAFAPPTTPMRGQAGEVLAMGDLFDSLRGDLLPAVSRPRLITTGGVSALDPLTSIPRIQNHVEVTLAQTAELRQLVSSTDEEIAKVTSRIQRLREARNGLRRACMTEKHTPPAPQRSSSLDPVVADDAVRPSTTALQTSSSSSLTPVVMVEGSTPAAKRHRTEVVVNVDTEEDDDASSVEEIVPPPSARRRRPSHVPSGDASSSSLPRSTPAVIVPMRLSEIKQQFVNVGARFGELPAPHRQQQRLDGTSTLGDAPLS